MSNTDSFIEEVNEELRRDKLYQNIRRYGWIAVLAVVLLVGGAAINEYRKASSRAAAEKLGDATMAALLIADRADQVKALGEIEATGAAAEIIALLQAGALASDDTTAAIEILTALATNPQTGPLYKDLANLKLVMLEAKTKPAADRLATLEPLTAPGAPFREIALEQKSLILVETGDTSGALEILQSLLVQEGVSGDLRQRATQLIVALGGEPKA